MPDLRPPRDNIVRAMSPGPELREGDGLGTMVGHFAVFNTWARIDSVVEGRFMERIAPGAFRKTFTENRDRIKVLFQHGKDPQIGDKPLGPISVLEEDATGARYEVPLIDTSYNRDLLPALKAGLLGASFRFSVMKDEIVQRPAKSAYNPEQLPERTIREAAVPEFGPVTFPAYPEATAGMRSMTDAYLRDALNPEALPEVGAEPAHSDAGSRDPEPPEATVNVTMTAVSVTQPERNVPVEYVTREEKASRVTELRASLSALAVEHTGVLPNEAQARWDAETKEQDDLERDIAAWDSRQARIRASTLTEDPPHSPPNVIARKSESDIYDLSTIRSNFSSPEAGNGEIRDRAMRAIETARFPHTRTAEARDYVTDLMDKIDDPTVLARRILLTGSPVYHRAFGKALAGAYLSDQEQRALSLTGAAGGFAVPITIDPTVIPTSNGSVNPLRAISRIVQITGDEWRGVSSGAVTVAYAAEATETTDNAPTIAQPTISTEKAQAFIPFSIEIGQDWGNLQADLGRLLQEGKDDLEADKFFTGSGTNEPFGVLTGATNTVVATTGQTFDADDLYRLEAALPPRYRARAAFVSNRAIYNLIRQFVLTGQSNPWKDLDQATTTDGRVGNLLGYPAFEASGMTGTTATNVKFLLLGDFSRFVIVDRIGLDVEVIQHLVGANHRPTGQRGLYAYFRNGSKVVDANGFRLMIGLA